MDQYKGFFGSLWKHKSLECSLEIIPTSNSRIESTTEDVRPEMSSDNRSMVTDVKEIAETKEENYPPINENNNVNHLFEEMVNKFNTMNIKNNTTTLNDINVSPNAQITLDANVNPDKIRILCQNVKSINDPFKKEYFKDIMRREKVDILILTETWQFDKQKDNIRKYFPKYKTILSNGEENSHKGRGIAIVIKYPLAQQVISYRHIPGRLIRIIFKCKKKEALALYAIQAPTAPYGNGANETAQLNHQIIGMLNEDSAKRRRIILAGDLNSYADRTLDYQGQCSGQMPSIIISTLQNFGLLDIYRISSPHSTMTTFKNSLTSSRLDQFWISPQIFPHIIKTSIQPFEETISDHAGIFLEMYWNHKKKKSSKFNNTIWNNKNEAKLTEWALLATSLCDRYLKPNYELSERNFRKKYNWVVKKFKKYAKKVFWIKKRRKRNEKPPIWLYTMRKLRKAERTNSVKAKKLFVKILNKYYPDINPLSSYKDIRMQLKNSAQRLIQQKIQQKIRTAIATRFNAFSSNISHHIDNILDRKMSKVDTSFVKKENEIIFNETIVKREFLEHYKHLFGSDQPPDINEIGEWEEKYNVTFNTNEYEVQNVLSKMASNKAPGITGLLIEMIKFGGLTLLKWMVCQMNTWMQSRSVPRILLKSQIFLIPKGEYTGDISNTRPINLIEAVRKLFSSILVNRIQETCLQYNVLNGWNFGFSPGKSTADPIKILQLVNENAKAQNKQLVIMFLDIKKAYDSVHSQSIMESLKILKFGKDYWRLLKNMFEYRQMRILTQAGSTAFFHPKTGLEQGDPSSPILWNFFYESLLAKLHSLPGYMLGHVNISYLAYADDLTLIASSDTKMQRLLDEVIEYLNFHRMQIQPKKSLVVSNFEGKTYQVQQNGTIEKISRASKKDIITYLGAPFSLLKNKNVGLNVSNEISKYRNILKGKKISSSIAAYIINSVFIPTVCYRFTGQFQANTINRKFENIFCGIMKRVLGLPRSYPHSLLQSTTLPITIRNFKDVHEEQEVGNIIYWLNSESPTSIIVREVMRISQKCHPIFCGARYQVRSKYINDMWKVFEEHKVECIAMEDILRIKNGIFTCQYYSEEPHDEQAGALQRYNISKINNLMQVNRKLTKFKSVESIARKKDLQLGLELPETIQELYRNEQAIVQYFKKGIVHHFKEISELRQEIIENCIDIPIHEQDFDTVYTDGSYDPATNKAGIAAICIRNSTKEIIHVSRHVASCNSSTEAEIQAILLGLFLMEKYVSIRTLKTDSQAAIYAIERKNRGRELINEKFRFWLTEIRTRILKFKDFSLQWIKGHSKIIGNEIADVVAKEAITKETIHEELISRVNPKSFYLWNKGCKVDDSPRRYIKLLHKDTRNNYLFQKSRRFMQVANQLEQSELNQWFCTLKSLQGNLNSSWERENLIKFLMKAIGDILPTADLLKKWKLQDDDKCVRCQSIETKFHTLEAVCRKESLETIINDLFRNRKAKGIFSYINWQNIILTVLERSWNFKNAIGIISEEILLLLRSMDIQTEEISFLGKQCLKVGYTLWKLRCKERMRLTITDTP